LAPQSIRVRRDEMQALCDQFEGCAVPNLDINNGVLQLR
jgi:hypothetical protein